MKYARTPDLGTRFPLSESCPPPTNNAAHEIHHIYTASTANDDGPWTPGTLQLLPFYHYNIDSICQLLSGPLGRASPANEDLLYAFTPRLHTIARASAPYNNDIEITKPYHRTSQAISTTCSTPTTGESCSPADGLCAARLGFKPDIPTQSRDKSPQYGLQESLDSERYNIS
ncbi:hypothetical protein B0H11DRAFT_2223314 [Mycena galericulata]|nr:hypothetical protein B0H11DRAFT_2223314 [Mycena galericulata]